MGRALHGDVRLPLIRSAAFAALLLVAVPAAGQDTPWTFDLTTYGWLSATDGRMGADGRTVGVSNSFRDTIQDSDTVVSLMGRLEARRARLGLFLDAEYTRLGYDDLHIENAVANATSTLFILEFGATWELMSGELGEDGNWALDALGGGRWTRVRNEITVNSGGPAADSRTDWVDPIVGLRLRGQFAPRWEYTLRGGIGGFGVGSEFAWQAIATVGYRFELFGLEATALVGYRALSQNYESSRLIWDVTLHGPLVGLNLRF